MIQLGNFIEHIVYAVSGAQSDKQDRQPSMEAMF